MTSLYHQLGHRYNWSIASLQEENTGKGLIIGPRYIERSKVEGMPRSLRTTSIFDPQFYLPGSSRGKLSTYPFFPEIVSGGFSTEVWGPDFSAQSAEMCLRFQVECEFECLTMPTRFRAGMPSDFIEAQTSLFVDPFLTAYRNIGSRAPLLLQLVVTDQMVKDELYRRDLLNWVTGISDLSGVYLIFQHDSRRKQIDDIDFLLGQLFFVYALKQAGMKVVVGYLNTEALLLLAAEPDILTMGSYENLRMFNLAAFESETETQRRGPNARVYVSRLLQWIEHQYIGAIKRVVRNSAEFFDESQYRVTMFEPTYNWHFTKPEPYRHYFVVFARQFSRLAGVDRAGRARMLAEEFQRALREFQNLEERGIVFDRDSSGAHLPAWLTSLNLFEQAIEEGST